MVKITQKHELKTNKHEQFFLAITQRTMAIKGHKSLYNVPQSVESVSFEIYEFFFF